MAKIQNREETGKNILADAIKNPPKQNRDTVFYFSHEGRLEKAAQSVQDFNNSKGRRAGVFATLTGTRSNTVLLITILVFCALISVISKVVSDKSVYKLDGNALTVSAMRYEGKTFVVIKKKSESAGAYSGAVDVAVSPEKKKGASSNDSDPTVFTNRLYFMPDESEEFRISVPMEIENIVLLMRTEAGQVVIRTKAG